MPGIFAIGVVVPDAELPELLLQPAMSSAAAIPVPAKVIRVRGVNMVVLLGDCR
jgi:hypothetical protein